MGITIRLITRKLEREASGQSLLPKSQEAKNSPVSGLTPSLTAEPEEHYQDQLAIQNQSYNLKELLSRNGLKDLSQKHNC